MGNLNFDASEVAPFTDNFEPIPANWYQMQVVEAEMTLGKSPDAGEMLKLQLQVDAEAHMKYAGRRVFSYLCINHKGNSVRNIARRQLSSIAHALGEKVLDDTDQLVGQMLLVRLKVRPAANGYDASNDAAGYAAIDSEADTQDAKEAPKEEPISGATKRGWK
jgi:hypothetical protein